jgi:acyl-CoA synthetase (AMP-forming)/AMP-acid ligase II
MAGYMDPELDAEFYSAEGWFRTGDVAALDPEGRLTILDRIKDIIIRGGENISAKEVEDVIAGWSQVSEVSVIGVPDEDYGERTCAFLSTAGDAVDLDQVREFLGRTRLEKFKWPERLVIVDDFPRTASGKVRKQTLREHWRAEQFADREEADAR